MSEAQDAVSRIRNKVKEYVQYSKNGAASSAPIQASGSILTSVVDELVGKARAVVRNVDPANDMTFMRITLKQHEILIAPGHDFRIIALQEITTGQEDQGA